MMKKTRYIVFILICVFICGCRENTTLGQLDKIDSLLSTKQIDSAKTLISRIDTSSLNHEEMAFYNLLNMTFDYKTYKSGKSYSGINNSISYYEGNGDAHKLARAYFVKGASLLDESKNQEGISLD